MFVSSFRPDLTVASDGDGLAHCEEAKIFDGSKWAPVILNTGIVRKDLHPPVVQNYVRDLLNFQSVFRSHHLGQLRPFIRRSYPTTQRGIWHFFYLVLAIWISTESLNA